MRSGASWCVLVVALAACGEGSSRSGDRDDAGRSMDAASDARGEPADAHADGGGLDVAIHADDDAALDATPHRDATDLDGPPSDPRDATHDASVALPTFPELAIGPYRACLAMLLASIRSNAESLDTSRTYGHSAAQGYLLQAIGELLWAARGYDLPARDELVEIALAEVEELRAAADRTTGAAPAFGLEDAWDAFGDGSTNPAFTAYTWQSGMVALGVAKLVRVLDALDHPSTASTRDFGVALVARWDAHHSTVADGGYWWYSTEPSDAIAVHNTSVLVAMASQLLSESGGPASLAGRPRAAADLLWARMRGNPTIGYAWNYADDGYPVASRRAEDVSHALVTTQMMRFARDRDWWSNSQMQGVAATLLGTMWTGHPARLTGFVDGTRAAADDEWTWSAAAVIGYAAHGDSPGGDPEVFDAARSILFSSYLARHDRALEGATVDSVRTLALALLVAHRPTAFAGGSRWEREAGPGDDAIPTAPGGARFYIVDWDAPARLSAGIELPARVATSANANLLVDLDDAFDGRVVVSLVYRSSTDATLSEWDGDRYHVLAPMPATRDETGTLRWFRTTFELDRGIRFDYQPAVAGTNVLLQLSADAVAVHRIEATPL
ncbi:MAG: hypothetical protein IT379_05855 [Deltaproteobacteria bacterium]|nr:hypothetical protein [Deltaproteobacteria bacterium]